MFGGWTPVMFGNRRPAMFGGPVVMAFYLATSHVFLMEMIFLMYDWTRSSHVGSSMQR